jgi:hypothetical protein
LNELIEKLLKMTSTRKYLKNINRRDIETYIKSNIDSKEDNDKSNKNSTMENK